MIKTLIAADRSERERFRIPRSVQQSIPIQKIYRDGIWQTGGKFSRTWRFADINYALASHEDQRDMFTAYCGALNSLPTDATTKITINNRRLNGADFQRSVLMRERGDSLDSYRREYNRVLTDKAAESNDLIQDKYITVSVARKNMDEARTFFHRVDADLSKNFGRLESGAKALDNQDRLRIFHDFFRPGEEEHFRFDLSDAMKKGHDFRDYICPDGLCFKADHFEMGGKVGRVLFLRDYASYIKDEMISKLSDFPRNLMLSIDILPIPTDEAIREVQSRILGIEADIARWQQRQNSRNNFTASIPYELEQLRTETKEFLDDLSTRDQRMIFANVTIVHIADTLEQLNTDTETLQAIGLEQACQFSVLRYQQEDGLNTALPYGLRRIKTTRTLTTESIAVLMPFRVQEIQDAGGIYYGVNAVSKNLLICNRKKLLNPHGFVLGVSGSGKSFSMKEAITFIALSTNDDIIMIDAEREYGELTRALQGAVLEISPSSPHHINPLDINRGYGAGENPVAMKSELMMSICEQQMGVGQLGAFHKSIIDRCTANIYHDFIKSGGEGRIPTLPDWRNEVKRQPEREAQELALASELFVEGSLNMFAHETNFDIDNRIVCFDLYEMGEQLKPTALNVVLETIQNRVAANRLAGRYTWVFVDEVYLFFKYYYSAQFLYKCWKRFRKYAAAMTAATQNIEECLHSETARLMLANSEFLILLNQAATDRPHHINPLDINRGYGAGENPVAMKSELMMSICEQQMGVGQLGAFHKSIIDRCTANIYHDFIKSGGEGRIPTLPDWRNEVKRQPEREAQELALASELFVEGSLNMFAHETNFDIDNRIVCFDLYEMGEQLKPTALNVVLETIQNRVAANRLAGRYTWVFVDEVYLFFKYYYSAQFLYKCWKRFRKYAAAMTAATQNIEECLRSETARLMLANSEFLILLNQAATDRAELAKLLHISETQMSHVTNVEAGHGLMRIGSSIIPFINEFPRDSELYRLMSTTPGDK